jgi:hypothetical protein
MRGFINVLSKEARFVMNNVFSLTIFFLMTSVCCISAMERGEGVAKRSRPTQIELDALLKRQRESAKKKQKLNRDVNVNLPVRRNLAAELDLYEPNRGEDVRPVNNFF